MSITKTIGGTRLGSGNKMTTSLRNYDRSTHDLGKVVRTTMATGTLDPVYFEPMLKGDIWEMKISNIVRTHPTAGPIFGSWIFRVDVFTADMRLYNKQLHNNLTGVGMNMGEIKFPQMILYAKNPDIKLGELNQQQISPSSLLAKIGTRGLGTLTTPNGEGDAWVERNGHGLLIYWDIVKEYYANKQEEEAYVIAPEALSIPVTIKSGVARLRNGATINIIGGTTWDQEILPVGAESQLRFTGDGITTETIFLNWRTIDLTEPISTPLSQLEATGIVRIFQYQNIIEATLNNAIFLHKYGEGDAGEGAFAKAAEDGKAIGEAIAIARFPLSNIDETREEIFAQPKTSPYEIGGEITGLGMNRLPYNATTGTQTINGERMLNSKLELSGLAIKTYQSDHFNNWLQTTWIERISDISAVTITDGKFTMDALNMQKKVYDLLNRVAVSGGTYQDWLEAVYGERTAGAPEMPVYVGGMSTDIVFDEVVSSSEAIGTDGTGQPLGTLGGRGNATNERGGNLMWKVNEHGYVMAIASLTPRIDYSQGNKWHTHLKTMDDLHKPQLDGIGFQELITDQMAAWDTKLSENNPDIAAEQFFSAGKQPAWIQYMTNTNEAYGNFAREEYEMFMTLNRRYQPNNVARISDLTTYIDPTKFNYPFAYTPLENQPFWVQIGFDVKVRRKMSAAIIPNL